MTGRTTDKICILGTGSRLRRDDGAGSVLAERLASKGVTAFDCATMPENFTGRVRSLKPHTVVIIDACEMGIEPGEFRLINIEKISDCSGFDSHSMALCDLMGYLKTFVCRVLFLGIEPENIDFGEDLTENVKKNIEILEDILLRGALCEIEELPWD